MADDGLELVMPFIVCASKGGPFDDAAYVAGWEMGQLNVDLAGRPDGVVERILHVDNVPQADLVAMRHGFQVERIPVPEGDADGWACVRFTKLGEG
jgi:hypothetical protein